MSLFSWQDQNLCGLSLAFIIDWRVVRCNRKRTRGLLKRVKNEFVDIDITCLRSRRDGATYSVPSGFSSGGGGMQSFLWMGQWLAWHLWEQYQLLHLAHLSRPGLPQARQSKIGVVILTAKSRIRSLFESGKKNAPALPAIG